MDGQGRPNPNSGRPLLTQGPKDLWTYQTILPKREEKSALKKQGS